MNVDKKKIFSLLSSVSPTVQRCGECGAQARSRIYFYLLVVSLIATMLPHPLLNILSSLAVLISVAAWAIASVMRRSQWPVVALLVAASITSGCAGPIFDKTAVPLDLLGAGDQVKLGTVEGVGVFGLGLDQVTAEHAIEKVGIKKPIAMLNVRGYGLISMAKVQVYGE